MNGGGVRVKIEENVDAVGRWVKSVDNCSNYGGLLSTKWCFNLCLASLERMFNLTRTDSPGLHFFAHTSS